MRQAIITKYLAPTETKGARIKAKAFAGSVTIDWDDSIDVDENHLEAAKLLCAKFEWKNELVGGSLPDNTGNCYVLL